MHTHDTPMLTRSLSLTHDSRYITGKKREMALFTFCAKWVTVSIAILSVVLGVIMFEVVPLLPGKVTLVSAAGGNREQKQPVHNV